MSEVVKRYVPGDGDRKKIHSVANGDGSYHGGATGSLGTLPGNAELSPAYHPGNQYFIGRYFEDHGIKLPHPTDLMTTEQERLDALRRLCFGEPYRDANFTAAAVTLSQAVEGFEEATQALPVVTALTEVNTTGFNLRVPFRNIWGNIRESWRILNVLHTEKNNPRKVIQQDGESLQATLLRTITEDPTMLHRNTQINLLYATGTVVFDFPPTVRRNGILAFLRNPNLTDFLNSYDPNSGADNSPFLRRLVRAVDIVREQRTLLGERIPERKVISRFANVTRIEARRAITGHLNEVALIIGGHEYVLTLDSLVPSTYAAASEAADFPARSVRSTPPIAPNVMTAPRMVPVMARPGETDRIDAQLAIALARVRHPMPEIPLGSPLPPAGDTLATRVVNPPPVPPAIPVIELSTLHDESIQANPSLQPGHDDDQPAPVVPTGISSVDQAVLDILRKVRQHGGGVPNSSLNAQIEELEAVAHAN